MRALIAGLLVALFLALPEAAAADGRHADPQLEALLPATLGGVVLIRESQRGTDLMTSNAVFDGFLASLNKGREDFLVGSAYSNGGLKAAVSSWQVKGADSDKLFSGFKATIQASSKVELSISVETLSGQKVTRIGDPGQLAQGPIYAYADGDAVFFVQTPDRDLAKEALGKLPH